MMISGAQSQTGQRRDSKTFDNISQQKGRLRNSQHLSNRKFSQKVLFSKLTKHTKTDREKETFDRFFVYMSYNDL